MPLSVSGASELVGELWRCGNEVRGYGVVRPAMPRLSINLDMTQTEWFDDAACRDVGTDVFFPVSESQSDDAKAIFKDRALGKFKYVDSQLAGKDYLMGKQFTVADGYLYTVMRWSPFIGIDLAKWPVLAAYEARVAARPKVQEAMAAEGLLKHAVSA